MASSDGPELEEVKNREQCPHQVISMTRSITPFRDLQALYQMYRFLKKERPEIVHSHTPKAGLIAMLAAKMAGVPHRIHTIAGLRFMTASGLQRRILVWMEKLTAGAANHVWPNSPSLKDYLLNHRLVNRKKMEVIGKGSSNGINLSRFNRSSLDPGRLKMILEQTGFDPQLKYLLCIGRIVRDKGIEELTKAFTSLATGDANVRLVLVGSFEDDLDPVSPETRNILHTHPQIILTGWSDAVEYYLSFATLLVHPSHREGFPNVLMQAGAMHCPVICSSIEGNIDIIEHQETGLLFPAKSEEELGATIRRALTHPEQMQLYADANENRIRTWFEQVAVHRLILEKYRQLTG